METFFSGFLGLSPSRPPTPVASNANVSTGSPGDNPNPVQPATRVPNDPSQPTPADQEKGKKKGFWGRIFGGSKDDDKSDNKETKPAATPSPGINRPH